MNFHQLFAKRFTFVKRAPGYSDNTFDKIFLGLQEKDIRLPQQQEVHSKNSLELQQIPSSWSRSHHTQGRFGPSLLRSHERVCHHSLCLLTKSHKESFEIYFHLRKSVRFRGSLRSPSRLSPDDTRAYSRHIKTTSFKLFAIMFS
jgi:hypothetical protein